jgi:hypothetical protein
MYDWEVSKFVICQESLFPINFGFVTGMPTCHALTQLSISKVV